MSDQSVGGEAADGPVIRLRPAEDGDRAGQLRRVDENALSAQLAAWQNDGDDAQVGVRASGEYAVGVLVPPADDVARSDERVAWLNASVPAVMGVKLVWVARSLSVLLVLPLLAAAPRQRHRHGEH